VVFPSHTEKVFHLKIVCLVLVVFGNIFCIYIALFSCFLVDSHKEGVWVLLLLPSKWYQSQVIIFVEYLVLNYGG
jgi:hypothetical protein